MFFLQLPWFYLALVQIFLSASIWLILKSAQSRGVSNEESLFVYFTFLFLIILGWHLVMQTPLILPPFFWLGVLFIGGIAAAISNLLLLYSFEKSPNPGFSVSLVSTQALWVTLIGLLFFRSPVSWLSLVGITLILFGVFLIHGWGGQSNFRWGVLALLAALASAFYWLAVKMTSVAIPTLSSSVILLLVVLSQLMVFATVRRSHLALDRLRSFSLISLLALGGLVGVLGNLAGITAVLKAPNPGYPLAVASASTLVVIFASHFFFKSSLRLRYVIATLIIVLGVIAIRMGSF